MKALLDAGHAARRLHDRHRPDGRREPRRDGHPRPRRRRRPPAVDDPIHADRRPRRSCAGSLAPDGCVVKIAGIPGDQHEFEGTARVFDGEQDALQAVLTGQIDRRRRHRDPLGGPQGRPGHARDAGHDGGGQGRRARRDRRAADRRPLLGRHPRLLDRPRRPRGGRRRPDRPGRGRATRIRIDVPDRTLDLLVDDDELARRREAFTPLEPRYTRGVLAKYARTVSSGVRGRDHVV